MNDLGDMLALVAVLAFFIALVVVASWSALAVAAAAAGVAVVLTFLAAVILPHIRSKP